MAEPLIYTYPRPDGSQVRITAPSREEADAAYYENFPDEAAAAPPEEPGALDFVKGVLAQSAAAGLKGAAYTAGIPGTLNDYATGLIEKFTGGPPEELKKAMAEADDPINKALNYIKPDPGKSAFSSENLMRMLSDATGGYTDRVPQNTTEEYANTLFGMAPTAVALGGATVPALLRNLLAPALTSETAGQFARKFLPKEIDVPNDYIPGGSYLPDKLDTETISRIAGAFAGPSLLDAGKKVLTPNPARPGRLDAAKVYDKEGITYSAGQKTGSDRLLAKESELGGNKMADIIDESHRGFNRAALKRIDQTADYATPEVLTKAHKVADDLFAKLKNNDVLPSSKLGAALKDVRDTYINNTSSATRVEGIEKYIDSIVDTMKVGGKMTGQQYQDMITNLRKITGSPETTQAAAGIREALDDAMEASIRKTNPDQLGDWAKARKFWKDLRAIEDTVTSGAGGAYGNIQPAKLDQVITNQIGRSAKAQGKDDLGELARAGRVMTQGFPNSGTATRTAARTGQGSNLLGVINQVPIVGPLASRGITKLHGAAIMSGPGQKYLGMQLLKPSKGLPNKPMPFVSSGGLTRPVPPRPTGGLLRLMQQAEQAMENVPKNRGKKEK